MYFDPTIFYHDIIPYWCYNYLVISLHNAINKTTTNLKKQRLTTTTRYWMDLIKHVSEVG